MFLSFSFRFPRFSTVVEGASKLAKLFWNFPSVHFNGGSVNAPVAAGTEKWAREAEWWVSPVAPSRSFKQVPFSCRCGGTYHRDSPGVLVVLFRPFPRSSPAPFVLSRFTVIYLLIPSGCHWWNSGLLSFDAPVCGWNMWRHLLRVCDGFLRKLTVKEVRSAASQANAEVNTLRVTFVVKLSLVSTFV